LTGREASSNGAAKTPWRGVSLSKQNAPSTSASKPCSISPPDCANQRIGCARTLVIGQRFA